MQRGKIPLLLAVEAGNQSMCRELLSSQTAEQLKAASGNGDTALHLAVRRKDVDMVSNIRSIRPRGNNFFRKKKDKLHLFKFKTKKNNLPT